MAQTMTPSVELAWEIAAAEAIHAGHQEIRPEDMVIGICKLPGLDQAQLVAADRTAVAAEARQLVRVFDDFGLDRTAFYRQLRQRVAVESPPRAAPKAISRSAATKAAFGQAAVAAGSGTVTSLHVLAALLDSRETPTALLLAELGIVAAALRDAVLTSAGPAPAAAEEGIIAVSIDADAQPFAGQEAGGAAGELRRGIQFVIELARDLALASSAEDLVGQLQKHLETGFPSATSGAITLSESGRLLLKAHWPLGNPRLSTTLAQRAATEERAFLWTQTEADAPRSVLEVGEACALYAPMLDEKQVAGVLYVGSQERPDAFSVDDLELLRAAAGQAGTALRALRLQAEVRRLDEVRSNLLRQFSPRVAERLSREAGRLRLGGERVSPVTVLMSDVRGFTAASEAMDPTDVVDMLNEMFVAFVPILFRYDATVDRFIGDAVLAVFGSPEADDSQWEKAVGAALEMQAAMTRLGEGWRSRGLAGYQVGIGIHTGPALHGFIGSPERMDYTVIGATVNRASRHCSAAGRGEVLISKEVYERVYRQVVVESRSVVSKHPETEPTLDAYAVTGLRS